MPGFPYFTILQSILGGLNISFKQKIHDLSGGVQQRVAWMLPEEPLPYRQIAPNEQMRRWYGVSFLLEGCRLMDDG